MARARMLALAFAVTAGFATAPGEAEACAVGGGPVAGYAVDAGFTLGWELTATYPCVPLAHWSLGGSYRVTPGDGPAFHHYAAWEPWLVVGATLGAAVDDSWNAAVAAGAWEGAPVFLRNTREQEAYEAVPAWMVTIAVGIRTLGAGLEIYLTPKLQWVERHDINT